MESFSGSDPFEIVINKTARCFYRELKNSHITNPSSPKHEPSPAPQPAQARSNPSAPAKTDTVLVAAAEALNDVLDAPAEKLVKHTGRYDEPKKDDDGIDMTACVQWHESYSPNSDGRLANHCQPPTQVELAWCTVGVDCQKSSTGNMQTLGPSGQSTGSVAVAGTKSAKMGQSSQYTVQWAACKGVNTMHVLSRSDAGIQFYCSKPSK